MKIIHCADLHLDSRMETNFSAEKARERRREILETFSRMVTYAKENNVSVIIIAGDMFDKESVAYSTQKHVLDVIASATNIDFLYLSGNHDEKGFLKQIEDVPQNLKLFGDDWQEYRYDNVSIFGSENYQKELITEKGRINIAVLHGQEGRNSIDMIDLSHLKNKNIDYVALGHIHFYQVNELDSRGVYCYCGCLEGRGFDECGDKGFVEITIDDELKSRFVKFAKRTFYEITFDISKLSSYQEIKKQLYEKLPNDRTGILKIVLIGSYSLDTIKDINQLSQELNTDYYFAKIIDNTSLAIDINDYANDISLRGEFVRLVLADESLTKVEKDEIIFCGISALRGEDIQ